MTPTYQDCIAAMRATKQEHTDRKIELYGYFDTDDHGYIPWEEPIDFEVISNHWDGGVYGPRAIGQNFRRWLDVHPLYIHPSSALAGAWVAKRIPGMGGWRPEDKANHLKAIQKKYNIEAPGIGSMNHLGPDMQIGLDLGWGGILDKIRLWRQRNNPADTAFYDGEEDLVLGVQGWIERHVTLAQQRAAEATDPWERDNYQKIAEQNAWLVSGAPRTLREACQFLAWAQSVDRMWWLGGALGQLDELLRPFYERDLASGELSGDEEAIWLVASLFFNDPHYSQIGGQAPDGHDLTSSMSFIILEAAHRLNIPNNLAIRVHDDIDPALLHKTVENLFEDGTCPSIGMAHGLDEGFRRNGYPVELARMRAKVGCNWTALPGIEYPLQDVTRHCLVSPFLHAFEDVMASRRGDASFAHDGAGMAEPDLGELPGLAPMDPDLGLLWERYVHHLTASAEVMKAGKDWHMVHQASNAPEIVLNLFCHGPIERGLDASNGGVDIYDLCVDAVGLATVADSFGAIERRVVDEKRLTWEELALHMSENWAGHQGERARLMMQNMARFGAGDSHGDRWAKRISATYTDLMRGTPTLNGFIINPGFFSHGTVIGLGKNLAATPNGRHDKDPISHSADPDPGFMPGGGGSPTAKANAVAAVQPGWGNTTPLQVDIDKNLALSMGGVEAVKAFLHAHNHQGGTMVNINIISKEQLLAAHENPEVYPDLVVRVTGYSAYFRSLSREYRQQVVDRFLASD